MVDVLKLQQRTARYELADGVRDFHTAFWILVTGIYAWLFWDFPSLWLPHVESMREQGTLFTLIVAFVIPIGVPLIISQVGLHLVNEYVRRRWLWRNTGFIKAKAWIVSRWTLFTSYAIVFAVFIAGIQLSIWREDGSWFVRSIWVGMGAGFAYLYYAVGHQMHIARYQWVALVGAIGTVIITVLPMKAGLFCLVLSLYWVVILSASGFYAMRQVAQAQNRLEHAT